MKNLSILCISVIHFFPIVVWCHQHEVYDFSPYDPLEQPHCLVNLICTISPSKIKYKLNILSRTTGSVGTSVNQRSWSETYVGQNRVQQCATAPNLVESLRCTVAGWNRNRRVFGCCPHNKLTFPETSAGTIRACRRNCPLKRQPLPNPVLLSCIFYHLLRIKNFNGLKSYICSSCLFRLASTSTISESNADL